MSAKKYCVARWEKYRRSDVHGLQRECNREYSDPSRYKNDVDLSRSSENIYLQKCNDWDAEISHVLEREGIKERSDSVVLVGGIYTASGDWMNEATEAQKLDYFWRCYDFECSRTHVINAVIHTDEAGSWHMHTAGIPIAHVPDMSFRMEQRRDDAGNLLFNANGTPKMKEVREPKRDENGNVLTHIGLSAKNIFGNKVQLSKTQTAFYEACGKPVGLERGKCRIDTDEKRKHLSEREYALSARKKELDEREKELRKQTEQVAELSKRVEAARVSFKEPAVDYWFEHGLKLPKPAKKKLRESYNACKADLAQKEIDRLREAEENRKQAQIMVAQLQAATEEKDEEGSGGEKRHRIRFLTREETIAMDRAYRKELAERQDAEAKRISDEAVAMAEQIAREHAEWAKNPHPPTPPKPKPVMHRNPPRKRIAPVFEEPEPQEEDEFEF